MNTALSEVANECAFPSQAEVSLGASPVLNANTGTASEQMSAMIEQEVRKPQHDYYNAASRHVQGLAFDYFRSALQGTDPSRLNEDRKRWQPTPSNAKTDNDAQQSSPVVTAGQRGYNACNI